MKELLNKFKGKCVYCGVSVFRSRNSALPPDAATRDHYIPTHRGGSGPDNIGLSCSRCNGIKGDMTYSEFRYFLQTGRIAVSYLDYLAAVKRQALKVHVPVFNHGLQEKYVVSFTPPKLTDEPWLTPMAVAFASAFVVMVYAIS